MSQKYHSWQGYIQECQDTLAGIQTEIQAKILEIWREREKKMFWRVIGHLPEKWPLTKFPLTWEGSGSKAFVQLYTHLRRCIIYDDKNMRQQDGFY